MDNRDDNFTFVDIVKAGFHLAEEATWGSKFQDDKGNTIYAYFPFPYLFIIDRVGAIKFDGKITRATFFYELLQSLELIKDDDKKER